MGRPSVGNKLGVIEEWMAGRLEQKAGVQEW